MKKIGEGIQRCWINIQLKTKFMLVFVCAVICLTTAALAGVSVVSRSYNELLYDKTAQALSVASMQISSELQKVSILSYSLATDPNIQNLLTRIRQSDDPLVVNRLTEELRKTLYNYFNSNADILSLCLFTEDGEQLFATWRDRNGLEEEERAHALELAREVNGQEVWFSGSQGNCIILSRLIRQSKNLKLDILGHLIIRVDLENIVNKATATDRDQNKLLLAGEGIFYPTEDAFDPFEDVSFGDKRYAIVNDSGEKWFAVSDLLPDYGWRCISMTDYHQVFRSIRKAQFVCVCGLLLAMLFIVLMVHQITGSILVHLQRLMTKMEQYAINIPPANEYDYTCRGDELGILHTKFDEMMRRISHLNYENYQKQLLLKDAQLKALEAQINPHFLFNTLNTINSEARLLKSPRIVSMVNALGNLLRAVMTQGSDLVPLEQELLLVKDYILIQSIRFEDRLNFRMEIEDQYKVVLVPKISIQPLVENAVSHALEELTEQCDVSVKAFAQEGRLYLQVYNSGSGIDPDILDKLREHKVTPRGNGVGLLNINTRLNLLYGEESGLRFENLPAGVIVSFSVPLHEQHDT